MENGSVMRYPENEASSPEKAYVYRRKSFFLGRDVWEMVVLGKSQVDNFRFVVLEIRSSDCSMEELAFHAESMGIPVEVLGFEPSIHTLIRTGNPVPYYSSKIGSLGEGGFLG